MAGKRADIKAGSAFVSLRLDNSAFMRGLQKARQNLQEFGASIMQIGTNVFAAGAAVVSTMIATATSFATTGGALNRMSKQTGVAASELSALQYAAEQTGAEFDAVEGALEELNIRMGETIRDGTGPAAEAFKTLGLNAQELGKMAPLDRFKAIATALSEVQDVAKRGFLADEILGGDAFKLLPLLQQGEAGIDSLMDKARELGIVMSDEDAAAAAALTAAFNSMKSTVLGLVNQIGASLAPILQDAAERLQGVTSQVITFVKRNRDMIATVFKIGAGIAAAGAAIVGFGGMVWSAAVALKAVTFAVGTLAGAVGFLLSPLGIVSAALVGGTVAFFKYSDAGQKALATLKEKATAILGSLKETFSTAFGGIKDAIMAGEWQLAGQIAMTSLRLVFTQGMAKLSEMVGGVMGDTIGKLTSLILGGDFGEAWNTVVLGMSAVWSSFTEGIVTAIANAAKDAVTLWKGAVDGIVNYILEQSSKSKALSDVFQVGGALVTGNAEEVIGPSIKDETDRNAALEAKRKSGMRRILDNEIEDAKAELSIAIDDGDFEAVERLKNELAILGDNLRDLDKIGTPDIFKQIETGTYSDPATQAVADRLTDRLNAMQEDARAKAAKAGEAFSANIEGGASGVSVEVSRIQKELDDLRKQAKAKLDAANREGAGSYGVLAADGRGGGMSNDSGKASTATFSGAAALLMGQGQSGVEQRVEKVEKAVVDVKTVMSDILGRINTNIKNQSLHHP